MKDQTEEITQLIEDIRYLKNTVLKTNRIFKFISSKALRPVYLSTGLLIIVFAVVIQRLIQHYGSYGDIPGTVMIIYYGLMSILSGGIIKIKFKMITNRVQELGLEMTVRQLFKEIYTWNILIAFVPYLLAMGLTVAFLVNHGLVGYLAPCLSILYGLMVMLMMNYLYLWEFLVGGIWFILTGFISLFILIPSQPLTALILTFGLGFIVMYIVSLVASRDQE